MIMYCPHCEALIDDDSIFCAKCGKSIEQADDSAAGSDGKYCSYCRMKIDSDSVFCAKCGKPVVQKTVFQKLPERTDDFLAIPVVGYCPHCNEPIDDDSIFCTKCGKSVLETAANEEISDEENSVAMIESIIAVPEEEKIPDENIIDTEEEKLSGDDLKNTIYTVADFSEENSYTDEPEKEKVDEAEVVYSGITDSNESKYEYTEKKQKHSSKKKLVILGAVGAVCLLLTAFILTVVFIVPSMKNHQDDENEAEEISVTEESSDSAEEKNTEQSSKESEEQNNEESSEESSKENSEPLTGGDAFLGEWQDANFSMEITSGDNGNYKIEICLNANSDGSKYYTWQFDGVYNDSVGRMEYTKGSKTYSYTDEKGKSQTELKEYQTLSGYFLKYSDEELFWYDYNEETGRNCKFHKKGSDSIDTEMSDMDYVGQWEDDYSKRAHMDIESKDGVNFDIKVYWSSSASERAVWKFTGEYNPSADRIDYTDGVKQNEVTDENGNSEFTTKLIDLCGCFKLNDNGNLYWCDYVDESGRKCVFKKIDSIGADIY